ncbi:YgjP-like metallopeptidase domain-containing protein [Motilimonas pumila]|uniref:M48 family peptidase n=1 Tax=Motilimonas pumila TaxID=2303987 RepID=A0A418YBF6_9GAMM|nr:YgjP-like metallopeptidase domain-containing protein [Motilimonas pumila]RJG41847.1 M48 family peptidase [Motilimonas pumila]
MKYLQGYPEPILQQVQQLMQANKLKTYLLNKYPQQHQVRSEKALYEFVLALKNTYLKKSSPLSKVVYDNQLHIVKHALGTHSYVNRVQGNKIKAKQEIRIAGLFRHMGPEMLTMIAVHELAHLKEKQHNKAFYQLCLHMQPNYHQVELDTRLYLTEREQNGCIYQ